MTATGSITNVTLIVAIIIATTGMISSIVGPLLLAGLTYRQRRGEREEDFARQDDVADRLHAAQDETIRRTQAVADAVTRTAAASDGKLNLIHTLVNSQLTDAIKGELSALRREVMMMREIITLKVASGLEPLPEAYSEVAAATIRIAELQATIDRREEKQAQAAVVDDQSEGGEVKE